MGGHRREIIGVALVYRAGADSAGDFPADAVAASFRVDSRIDKETRLDGAKIAAGFKHFLEEEDGAFF